jgi:hypothetical protein
MEAGPSPGPPPNSTEIRGQILEAGRKAVEWIAARLVLLDEVVLSPFGFGSFQYGSYID